VLVEQRQVNRLQISRNRTRPLVLRRVFAVHEVIIVEIVTGRRPLTRSCTASRLANVVMPDEEGPAISTTGAGRGCVDVVGDMRDLFFMDASAILMKSPISWLKMISFRRADGIDAKNPAPFLVLLEHVEQVRLASKGAVPGIGAR
jgi:hypothetical protein